MSGGAGALPATTGVELGLGMLSADAVDGGIDRVDDRAAEFLRKGDVRMSLITLEGW